jgi:hypothetical protein
MNKRIAGSVLCALFIAAAGAEQAVAQAAWDAPVLLPPRVQAGTGLYLIDAHGAGLGVLGTWRGAGGPQRLGFRFGVAERSGESGVAVLGGVDASALLATVSPAFPLDIAWFAGFGAGAGRWTRVTVPFGLSIGRSFSDAGFTMTPYLAPRLVVDGLFGRHPHGDSSLELDMAVDLGLELRFQPGWRFSFGASLGGRDALAFGIVF